MPELVYPPAQPEAYPPITRIQPGVTAHTVKYLPPRPGKNEKHGPPESFLDILKQYGDPADPKSLTFPKLIEFNFGLVEGEKRYFEKINWFLKHKLNCKKTTEKGNFMFSTGETIYIPRAEVVISNVPPIIVVRRKVGDVRWIRIAKRTPDGPQYEIPGVSRTSEAPDSKFPGRSGRVDTKAQALAALVQFVAQSASSWVANEAVLARFRKLEADFFTGGGGVGNQLQPVGPHQAVVVRVRMLASTEDASFPKTLHGAPQIIGKGDLDKVLDMVDDFERERRFEAAPPPKTAIVNEYYVATRLSKQ